MKFFPSESFEIHSPLDRDAAVRALAKRVEARRFMRFGSDYRPFEGTVSNERFAIERVVRNRILPVPLVRGSFGATPSGTTVTVRMNPPPQFSIPLGACYFMSALTGVGVLVNAFVGRKFEVMSLVAPLILVALWRLVAEVALRTEISVQREILIDVFRAPREGGSGVPPAR